MLNLRYTRSRCWVWTNLAIGFGLVLTAHRLWDWVMWDISLGLGEMGSEFGIRLNQKLVLGLGSWGISMSRDAPPEYTSHVSMI